MEGIQSEVRILLQTLRRNESREIWWVHSDPPSSHTPYSHPTLPGHFHGNSVDDEQQLAGSEVLTNTVVCTPEGMAAKVNGNVRQQILTDMCYIQKHSIWLGPILHCCQDQCWLNHCGGIYWIVFRGDPTTIQWPTSHGLVPIKAMEITDKESPDCVIVLVRDVHSFLINLN